MVAVAVVPQQKLALVVGTPQPVGLRDHRQRRARQAGPPPAAPMRDEAVPIQHGVDGADGGTRDVRPALADRVELPAALVGGIQHLAHLLAELTNPEAHVQGGVVDRSELCPAAAP